MNKKILAEFEIVIPDQWKEEQVIQMLAEYLKLNKVVDKIVHVTAYPMNYKLIVQHLELPKEMIQ